MYSHEAMKKPDSKQFKEAAIKEFKDHCEQGKWCNRWNKCHDQCNQIHVEKHKQAIKHNKHKPNKAWQPPTYNKTSMLLSILN